MCGGAPPSRSCPSCRCFWSGCHAVENKRQLRLRVLLLACCVTELQCLCRQFKKRKGERVSSKIGYLLQEPIDFLFLNGTPLEYLDYLKAAEPRLAPSAVIVADNAGVFAQGGLKPYLEYVRGSGKFESRFEASTLEWRDDVEDGLEVSVYRG